MEDTWVAEYSEGGFLLRRATSEDYVEKAEETIGRLKLPGWIALDDDYSIWFFPGKDNRPEKVNGEWQGFSPVLVERESEGPIPELLKESPILITFINE